MRIFTTTTITTTLFLFLFSSVVTAQVMPPWPLEGTVDYVREVSTSIPLSQPTGLKRADYLTTVSGVAQYFRQFQDAEGHIIDPYRGVETQYATPCFALAAALTYSEGLDDTILGNATAAITAASGELANKTCADMHCVFFMKPLMFAYRILAPKVPAAMKLVWDTNLQTMNPWVDFGWPTNNWGLVGTLDMLRTDLITHFGNNSWWTGMLDFQLSETSTFTANGLYQDHTGAPTPEGALNPLPYDSFPIAGYLTVMLREGYNGTHAPFLTEATRRGAWTHMLMQSPWGEVATGGRSSQHTWNEAVSAIAYEIFATKYAAAGDMASACMFQRAAHLSHASVKRWQNTTTGRLQIVKNNFDPSLRFGYEDYSYLSNYNLLPAAMLAAAYLYADPNDSIPECAAPTDVGGYVIQLPEHHVVIANAGGVYVEIETFADPNYDPTGMHRVHINTCGVGTSTTACVAAHTLLTLTAGPPFFTGPGTGIAIGPWWTTNGTSATATATATAPSTSGNTSAPVSLASLNFTDVAGISVSQDWGINNTDVKFNLEYYLLTLGAVVTQNYAISVNTDGSNPLIAVTSSVSLVGGLEVFRRAALRNVTLLASHIARAQNSSDNVMDEKWNVTSLSAQLVTFGVQFPVFLYDGMYNTTVNLMEENNTLTVTGPNSSSTSSSGNKDEFVPWGSVTYSTNPPAPGHVYTWTYDATKITNSRNGYIATAWVGTSVETLAPSFTQYVTASSSSA